MQLAKCGSCQSVLKFEPALDGHDVRCPHCQQQFRMELLAASPLPMKVELSEWQFEQFRSVMLLFVGSAIAGLGVFGSGTSGFAIAMRIFSALGILFAAAGAISFVLKLFTRSPH